MAKRPEPLNYTPANQTPAYQPPPFTPPVKGSPTQSGNPTIQVDNPQPNPNIPEGGVQMFPFGKGQALANIQSKSPLTDAAEQDIRQAEEKRKQTASGIARGVGQFTPEQQGAIQAASTGGGINPVAIGTAGAGLAAGAGTAIAAGAATGGIALLAAGAGALIKISSEKKQDVKQAYSLFTSAKSNLDFIQNQVNAGTIDPQTATDMWNEQLVNIRIAEANLKRDTRGNLKKFLSDGEDELIKLEQFQRTIGQRNINFQNALIAPNPNSVIPPTPEIVESQ